MFMIMLTNGFPPKRKSSLKSGCALMPAKSACTFMKARRSRVALPYALVGFPTLLLLLIWRRHFAGPEQWVPMAYAQGVQLAANPGFEEPRTTASGWIRDEVRTRGKGTIDRDLGRKHSGAASIKLTPSQSNLAKDPLAITQIIPASQYRGRSVEFSGFLLSEPGTQAILALFSLVKGRVTQMEMLFQPGQAGMDWIRHSKVYK